MTAPHVEKGGREGHLVAHTGMTDQLVAKAHAAAEAEKVMPWRQAVSIYWRGGLWSMGLSVALVMEGYDVGLVSTSLHQEYRSSQLNSFYGQPAFLESFGSPSPSGGLYIPANWQAGLSNAVSAGQVLGLLVSEGNKAY